MSETRATFPAPQPQHITLEKQMQTKTMIGISALALGLASLLALLLVLSPARAADTTRYVATTGRNFIPIGGGPFMINDCKIITDPCRTVQHAVNRADPGDEIRVATGVYTGVQATQGMTQVVYIDKSVTIRGGYTTTNWATPYPLTQPTVLDAQGLGRVVVISGSIAPTLEGFILTRGDANGQPTGCATGHGAPAGCGGGIFINESSPLIVNNVITGNIATDTFGRTGYGGGLYLRSASGAVISGNVIISNVANLNGYGDGGGLYLDQSSAQVRANQILSNYATGISNFGWGGGISVDYGAPTVENNILRGNRANPAGMQRGAALHTYNDSGLYRSNIIGDNAGESAVCLQGSRARLESNWVISNTAAVGVELFTSSGTGPLLINNIIARSGTTATIRAIWTSGSAIQAQLLHNTLVGSGIGSGIYVTGSATLFLTNTIIVSHTWGITSVTPASATVNADHTLFWANMSPGIQGTNPVNGDPRFVNPAGGDYHISAGSAAQDAGATTAITADIDGDRRPIGAAPDIGADERRMYVYLPLVLRND